MNAQDTGRSLLQRLRRPSTWAAVLGFGLLWVPARLLSGMPWDRMGVWEFYVPALFAAGQVLLTPVPWQWTGRGRAALPGLRGLVQAVPWNAAWVLLLLLLVHETVRPARPPVEESRPREAAAGQDRPRDEESRPPRPREGEMRPPRPGDREEPTPRQGEEAPAGEGRPPREEGPGREDPPRRPGPRPELMLLFVNLPFAVGLGWLLAEKERAERKGAEARERERQARARALQSQLHPHVLFNVLGGLTELVHEDADAAEQALVGLTELLRMLMHHGAAVALPLGQERTLLRRYLEIETLRLGPRLQVQWTWQEDLDGVQVPPLLLQPLVENAVKHGIAASPEGGTLKIDAVRTGSGMLLRVSNTGRPLDPAAPAGTGLGNLRERLALLPEPRPVLDLRQEGAWTVAELRLEGTLKA